MALIGKVRVDSRQTADLVVRLGAADCTDAYAHNF